MNYESSPAQEVSHEIISAVRAADLDIEQKVAALDTEHLDESLKTAINIRDQYQTLFEQSIDSPSEDDQVNSFIAAMEALMGTIENTQGFETEIGLRASQQIGESQE